jgi:outer membrane protein TolC
MIVAIVGSLLLAAQPLTLEGAVELALQHHPALRAQAAVSRAAKEDASAAHAAELPHLDLSAELLRATGNVLPGSVYSLPGIPSVTGPAGTSSFDSGAFGSMIGASASLDLVGLRRRMLLSDAALAEASRAQAVVEVRRLVIGAAAADAFLALLTQHQAVGVAEKAVSRAKVLATQLQTLARQDLRPGADAARALAELALAQTQLARARQGEEVRAVQLSDALGTPGERYEPVPGALLTVSPGQPTASRVRHPQLVAEDAAVEAAGQRTSAARVEFFPRVELAASIWLRGSGYARGGSTASPASGIVPDTPNWAAGLVISWPALEMFSVKARAAAAEANAEAAGARRDEATQEVESQIEAARAVLQGARTIAENTPAGLQAARIAEEQANARFANGLGTELDVVNAQQLLAQAELDDLTARLGVWSAMLLLSRGLGDLSPFLAEVRAAGGR